MYENAYYCREVSLPNVVIEAAERQARAKAQTAVPFVEHADQLEVADPLASMRRLVRQCYASIYLKQSFPTQKDLFTSVKYSN